MKILVVIVRFLMFGLLSACIGWYAGTFFKSSIELRAHEYSVEFLKHELGILRTRSSIPYRELFKLGYYLYDRGWYYESDQILRFTATISEKDKEWFNFERWAKGVLRMDDFQAFYESGVAVSNTFYPTDIEDKKLFDKESVRRKYGQPSEVVKPNEKSLDERWIYRDGYGNTLMAFEFHRGRLFWDTQELGVHRQSESAD